MATATVDFASLASQLDAVSAQLDAVSAQLKALVPPPPTPPARRLVKASDFVYKGLFHVPVQVPPYNVGAIALKQTAAGVKTLLVGERAADPGKSPKLSEITIPVPDPSNPPRASLVRQWADLYAGKRTWPIPQTSELLTTGLYWHPSGRLYWGYGDDYDAGDSNQIARPCLGFSKLNDDGTVTAFGPWTISSGGKLGRYLFPLPADLAALTGCTHAIGSGQANIDAGCSFGPCALAVNLPDENTPPGEVLETKRLLLYPEEPYAATRCRRPTVLQPAVQSGNDLNYRLPVGGQGLWTARDCIRGGCAVDTPTLYGVCFPVSFGEGTGWYGDSPYPGIASLADPADPTGHGQHATAYSCKLTIYDPADLASVFRLQRPSYAPSAAEVADWTATLGYKPNQRRLLFTAWDHDTGTLYVSADRGEWLGDGPRPAIHIFKLAS